MSFHVAPPLAGTPALASADRHVSLDTGAPALHLDRLGVVLALSPAVAGIRIGVEPAAPEMTELDDPIVAKLRQALENAEQRSEFGDVYADAVKLALAARLLTLRAPSIEQAVVEPQAPVRPAPLERPRSGLQKWRLKRVVDYIDAHLGESVTLGGMAAAAGLSRMHFAAQFRVTTGVRPHEFLLRRRIERAQALMLETREPLVQVALAVGFQTQAHFTSVFRRFVGDTPYQWRCAQRAAA
ncbi:helix-turn-helix domain-containing protein [Ancylobacter terrae]|uniref:helix-turn-helix domain-containing protein n=1 Tax=Ancylobacter sp. sgz301288 TaxID=3342077 RepID=UPI00385A27D4